ncbi:MAG: hypothetical protein HY883_02295 [Deltaproteobacteria bacterium]|nr:hypothetical protein [Deltaproteobacteria bacterium]
MAKAAKVEGMKVEGEVEEEAKVEVVDGEVAEVVAVVAEEEGEGVSGV